MAWWRRDPAARAIKRLVERTTPRGSVDLTPGSTVHGLVLGSTRESTTVIDLASRTIVRWRIPWPEGFETDLAAFDVVEGLLADDIERNDLAQPEAVTLVDLPRRLGCAVGSNNSPRPRTDPSSGSADPAPPTGSSAVSARAWLSSRPTVDPSCCDVPMTAPPGSVSVGTATTSGSCARTTTRFARSKRRAAPRSRARTWPRHSAFARPTC